MFSRWEPRLPSPSRRTGQGLRVCCGRRALRPSRQREMVTSCVRGWGGFGSLFWWFSPLVRSLRRAAGRGGQSLMSGPDHSCYVSSCSRFISEAKGCWVPVMAAVTAGEARGAGDEGESSVSRPGLGHRASPLRASVSPPVNVRSDRLGGLLLLAFGGLCCPHRHTSCHRSFPCPESLNFPSSSWSKLRMRGFPCFAFCLNPQLIKS